MLKPKMSNFKQFKTIQKRMIMFRLEIFKVCFLKNKNNI